MSFQVQVHLFGQALDVTMLPYSVALSGSSIGDISFLSHAMAAMVGIQTDLELGGESIYPSSKTAARFLLAVFNLHRNSGIV